jgi:LPS sulfotransferase NodH
MAQRFRSFVILGAMRTGSNFLEASLNEAEGIRSFGEAFNPHFVGLKDRRELLGVTIEARDADPAILLKRMREEAGGLAGFRFFEGHDPRVLDAVLADPACAKIVLTRDPLESFISLRIAVETGQWLLRNERTRKTARIRFDPRDFEMFRADRAAFYTRVRRALQTAGQTPFAISYPELSDTAVLNGLLAWLGVPGRLQRPSATLLRQNPLSMADKVLNPGDLPVSGEIEAAPATGEPARSAAVPTWIAAARAPLLYMPVRSGPVAQVEAWLAALDEVGIDALTRDFNRQGLRSWRALRPGFRSFTVLRHPAARAHDAFLRHILPTGPGSYPAIRARLRQDFGVPLPEGPPGADYTPDRHRTAFLGFLAFLKANLGGQTAIRVDGAWASQEEILRGFGVMGFPDLVLRDETLAEGLGQLAAQVGLTAPAPPPAAREVPHGLASIHDAEIEAAVRAAYARDYEMFGYGDWRAVRQP